jgi:KamA family protein
MSRSKKEWQKELINSIKGPQIIEKYPNLAKKLGITMEKMIELNRKHLVSITPHYAKLINWKNPDDPLMRLVFPSLSELSEAGLPDQSGEHMNMLKAGVHGVQHKYSATALILMTGVCATYCRFCFRRRTVGTQNETIRELESAFKYISKHPEINNILLTGGDAFMVGNRRIEFVLKNLRKIKHIGVIRFGSRMPVYLPSRFKDKDLMNILAKYNEPDRNLYVITHIDHPRELSKESIEAHRKLIRMGIGVRSQTVLSRGVNDDPKTLSELLLKMSETSIVPYYVFQCRPVIQATHYAVPLLEGYRIFEEAKKPLSGLAKSARYIMSHVSGKMEILNVEKKKGKRRIVLRHHQCREEKYLGKIAAIEYELPAYWLDDILNQKHKVLMGEDVVKYAKSQMKKLYGKKN